MKRPFCLAEFLTRRTRRQIETHEMETLAASMSPATQTALAQLAGDVTPPDKRRVLMAYTIGGKQPVLCTLVSDQPFYSWR